MTNRNLALCALLSLCPMGLFAAAPVSTTVSAALTPDSLQFGVASVTGLAPGYELFIDKEAMLIGSINGLNLTVYRGYDGTRPAGHAAATAIVGGRKSLFVRQSPSGSCDGSVYVDTLLDVTTGFTNTCTGGLWVSSGGGGGSGVPPGYTSLSPASTMIYTATPNAPIQQWASTLTLNATSSNVITTGFPPGGVLKWRLCNDATPRTHVNPTVNGAGSVAGWPGMSLSANVCRRIYAEWDGTSITVATVKDENLGGIGEGEDMKCGTAPQTPAAGSISTYCASSDKALHVINDAGTDTALGGGGGGGLSITTQGSGYAMLPWETSDLNANDVFTALRTAPYYEQFVLKWQQKFSKVTVYISATATPGYINLSLMDSTCSKVANGDTTPINITASGFQTFVWPTPPTLTAGVYFFQVTADVDATSISPYQLYGGSTFFGNSFNENGTTLARFFTGATASTGSTTTLIGAATCGSRTASSKFSIAYGVLP